MQVFAILPEVGKMISRIMISCCKQPALHRLEASSFAGNRNSSSETPIEFIFGRDGPTLATLDAEGVLEFYAILAVTTIT